MRGTYRMTWPVLDARVSLADIIGTATLDLRSAVDGEGCRQVAPVEWSLRQGERGLMLNASVDVVSGHDRPQRPVRPCGTHAAYARHRARGEDPDALCVVAEREYQRARDRRGRKHHTPSAPTAGAAGAQVAS